MNASQKQQSRQRTVTARYTRLRDYGAFGTLGMSKASENDISTFDTHEVGVVQPGWGKPGSYRVADAPTSRLASIPPTHPALKKFRLRSIRTAGVTRSGKRNASKSIAVEVPPQAVQTAQTNIDQENHKTGQIMTRRQKMKKYLSLLARVGLTILLFVFLFKSLSWTSLFALLGKARRALILMGLIIGATGVVISSYQWRSLLQGESIRFDLADLIDLYLVGTAFSHFLPTGMGGDAVKAIYVGREAGNTEGSASAVVMSRVTGFFGMLVIALAILLVQHARFAPGLLLWFALLSVLVGSMIAGAMLSVTLIPRLLRGRARVDRFVPGKVRSKVTGIGNALVASVLRPRSLAVATVFGVVFWITACLNYYSYSIAIGVNIPLYFYFVAIPFVSLVTFLPVSINGFGVRESAFIYVFSTMHVAAASSLFIVLLMDAQVIFFGVLGGCIYIMLNKKRGANQAPLQKEGGINEPRA